MTTTQRLYSLGGKVGSRLSGTDEDGTDVIEIVSIGAEKIVAKKVERNGEAFEGFEINWSLSMREWKLVE